jgi:serine/threonine protein kinase
VLAVGQTLSHYTIIEKIGKGGMGVVYKARDTRLNRLVAIKTLPPERIVDQDRNRRFIREAKAASALNHPNIITIYEIDTTDRVAFIAMEYIKGKTIREVLPPGGFNAGQALRYSVQIADALAALHREGIVHRDLKPTNIMIGENGDVKVLDFGLAKLTEEADTTDRSILTTAGQSEDGAIFGTLPYMSPEQINGKTVDTRSDIFSFGVLLYEMTTGRRPFLGEDRSSIAAAIQQDEPIPLTRIKASVPPEIERTVTRCLEKDPQRRFQNAADLKFALEWLARDFDSGKLRPMEQQDSGQKRRRKMIAAFALLVVILVLVAAMIYKSRSPGRIAGIEDPRRITFDLGLAVCPALSPDGTLLAYSSDRSGEGDLDIWVQQIAGGEPVQRTFDSTDEFSPNFSPNGDSIAFDKGGKGIFVVPSLAGQERQIVSSGYAPRFSPDGSRIVYWVGDEDNLSLPGKVYVAALAGGEPTQIGVEFADAKYPLWAPEGQSVLLQGIRSSGEKAEWWIVPVAPGPAVNTGILSELRKQGIVPMPGPGDWKGNQIAFSASEKDSRHIWLAAIKPPEFRIDGPMLQVTKGTSTEGELSISANNQIAYSSWNYHNNLWRISLQKDESNSGSPDLFSKTGAFDSHPSISADGKKMAFLSKQSGITQVMVRDLGDGEERSLTIDMDEKSRSVIAPDGSLVAYSKNENGNPSIFIVPTGKSQPGVPKKVCKNCGAPSDWLPDLSGILYASGTPMSVYQLDISSGISAPILRSTELGLDQPHISPDGRWIAFVYIVSPDHSRICIAPFNSGKEIPPNQWIVVTDGNSLDDKPRWRGNDSLIYYSNRDGYGCLWKQRLKSANKQPDGMPEAVHHFHEFRFSPRTLYRSGFEIAVTHDFVVINLVEMTGSIWLASLQTNF